MTPHQALRAGTLSGARLLGLDGDLGSIEPGKLADLAILDANPLENIRNSDDVAMVMANGRLFDARTMDAIGAEPKKRAPFWWELPAE
jgi:imidazolonepropionase-like amidohydrolase